MKRSLLLSCLFATLALGCSENASDKTLDAFYGYVGLEQTALALKNLDYQKDGTAVSINCHIDKNGKELCIDTKSGKTIDLSDNNFQYIDPAIAEAQKTHCESKTIAVNAHLKYDVATPNTDELSVYGNAEQTVYLYKGEEISRQKAENLNEDYRQKLIQNITKARKDALDAFVKVDAIKINDDQKTRYQEQLYEGLHLIMPACDAATFIEKTKNHLEILELSAVVENHSPKQCDKPIATSILLNTELSQVLGENGDSVQVIENAQALNAYKAHGLSQENIDSIDFETDTVLAISAAQKPHLGYSFAVDHACEAQTLEIGLLICANLPHNDALSYPILLLKLAKNDYEKLPKTGHGVQVKLRNEICKSPAEK